MFFGSDARKLALQVAYESYVDDFSSSTNFDSFYFPEKKYATVIEKRCQTSLKSSQMHKLITLMNDYMCGN